MRLSVEICVPLSVIGFIYCFISLLDLHRGLFVSALEFEEIELPKAIVWEDKEAFVPEDFDEDAARTKINSSIVSEDVITKREKIMDLLRMKNPIDLSPTVANSHIKQPQIQLR